MESRGFQSTANTLGIQGLPRELLVALPEYLHNIEDYVNLSSTCRLLRSCMAAAHPHTILHLAWASSRVFFRPSPHFLYSAIVAQVGAWARESDENEAELVAGMPMGVNHIMELALREKQVGLTMERIRQFHEMRFSVINPITDLIDKCVGRQWYEIPNFWEGGADDAATINADEEILIYLLAAYGELFGPDFEPFLNPDLASRRRLKIETRLEFVKYCIPDGYTAMFDTHVDGIVLPDGSLDPRRTITILKDGPYDHDFHNTNALALIWLMKSTRWRPHWKKARQDAGAKPDFAQALKRQHINENFHLNNPPDLDTHWKQNMLETLMQCQGMEALGVIRPGTEIAERYKPRIREWREKIERLEVEPRTITVCNYKIYEYPDLWGELFACSM
ncbi:hypothetical protein F4805DRAFT_418334 [Annulohypoxylon moriforme]|nr:hypothetical protein F4805DRAFT_418334 [Annulohypoxylon moriforme]